MDIPEAKRPREKQYYPIFEQSLILRALIIITLG
jgi:hypothetical protein